MEKALLRAIKESPADDSLRLILADWLEDAGDPARAEFVRVQVALANLAAGDPGFDSASMRRRRNRRSAALGARSSATA